MEFTLRLGGYFVEGVPSESKRSHQLVEDIFLASPGILSINLPRRSLKAGVVGPRMLIKHYMGMLGSDFVLANMNGAKEDSWLGKMCKAAEGLKISCVRCRNLAALAGTVSNAPDFPERLLCGAVLKIQQAFKGVKAAGRVVDMSPHRELVGELKLSAGQVAEALERRSQRLEYYEYKHAIATLEMMDLAEV